MSKIIVCLSGGIDSAVVLATVIEARSRGEIDDILCVSFNYGSKHNTWENMAAIKLAESYDVPHQLFNAEPLMGCFKSNLMRGQEPIPEGHYKDETMKQTVVPGRNLIFLSVLAGYAASIKYNGVCIGIHAGDHAIYPDCRPAFFNAARRTILLATNGKIVIMAPFIMSNKVDIVKRGMELKVPFRLTRTCYTEQRTACGRCGSCVERKEAFALNGEKDPIEYAGE